MNYHHFHEWAHLLLRLGHFLAGIMWIGTSFYFVWMDSSFDSPINPRHGVDGELWMVHGGNFYHVEKKRFGPGEMPAKIHWFKWEATLTWISGFILLVWVYYLTNGAYLIDPRIKVITPLNASLIGLTVVTVSWFFYDFLFRLPIKITAITHFIILLYFSAVVYFLTHTLSGRGAFIHLGAIFGTIMLFNVWRHILPNQKYIIEASNGGLEPNYDLGIKAKKRSMHNSYMTLPVLFIMISNHFPMTYSHQYNWIILILISAFGAFIRHFMITLKKTPIIIALGLLFILISFTAPKNNLVIASDRKISFQKEVKPIFENRCIRCHSRHPSDDEFTEAPLGVNFEQVEIIQSLTHKIYNRVIVQKDMPLQNKTQITDLERSTIGQWIKQGAIVDE